MTAYQVVELFKLQVERRTGLKAVIVPSPVKDAAPTVRISVRKVVLVRDTVAHRANGKIDVRLTIALDGKVESLTGLRLALEACEALGRFMATASRLEDDTGNPVPDCSITSSANIDDGVLEDPENGAVAWIRDEHFATISIPM